MIIMRILIVIMTLLAPVAAIAEENYFHDRADGWFWYINPEVKQKKDEKKPTKQAITSFATVEELQNEAKILLNQAVMEPTTENITAYLTIQKIVFEKSETFAHKWQEAVWTNPVLDYTAIHPVSQTGLAVYREEKDRQKEDELKNIAQHSGIFFIFSSTCQYCMAEAGVLKTFEQKYGFRVLPVTMDGKGLSEYPFPKPDNGISERLGVERTPSIFLASPPDKISLIASGVLTLDELEERVFTLGKKMLYETE